MKTVVLARWKCQGLCVPGYLLVAVSMLLGYMFSVYWQACIKPRGDIQINTYSHTSPPEPCTGLTWLIGIKVRSGERERKERDEGGGGI